MFRSSPLIIIILLSLGVWGSASDPVLSHPEVLNLFKDCQGKKENLFLVDDKYNEIKKRGLEPNSKIYKRYVFDCNGKTKRTYVISNKVRTHYQAAFIKIEKDKIGHYTLLSFNEPREYLPPKTWFKSLTGKLLKKDHISPPIDTISGATLTKRATDEAVKLAFALDEIFR
ncbi:MAG: FMN-binding protein [Bacteriovoracaceae bacterium]